MPGDDLDKPNRKKSDLMTEWFCAPSADSEDTILVLGMAMRLILSKSERGKSKYRCEGRQKKGIDSVRCEF